MNTQPTIEGPMFNADGHPTEATLNRIQNWPPDDLAGLMRFAEMAWDSSYGRVWAASDEDGDETRFATGGWSGNESIISAMQQHQLLFPVLWKSSHRGGLHVFKKP